MPVPVEAGLWALLGASALIIGATVAWFLHLSMRVTAGIMAFGCGVLISAVAYDLLQDGYEDGGIWPVVLGAVAGSLAYAVADWAVSRSGGHDRKRAGGQAPDGEGVAVAVGSLLDGIPESIVLGVGLVAGEGVSLAMFAAIFLSNLPEGLSSATGMKADGRSAGYVFGIWVGIVVASGVAASLGAAALADAPVSVLATVNAIAAGGLLTMVVNTMIPEAAEGEAKATGVLATLGLLVAFALTNA